MIHARRMTARLEGGFCVFLIGMRINRPWMPHKWLPVLGDMPRMLAELSRRPELGYLGGHLWFGRTTLALQYWRSFEALTEYARRPDLAHLPAWQRFRRRAGDSPDVGIWHETYRVADGQYETIYHHMPPFGLGRVGELTEITGYRHSASGRLQGPGISSTEPGSPV